jgi:hypothetical protein
MDTLAVQLTLPLAGCVEDLHLLVSAPCRAHQQKRAVSFRGSPSRQSAYLMVTVNVVLPVMFELLLSAAETVTV